MSEIYVKCLSYLFSSYVRQVVISFSKNVRGWRGLLWYNFHYKFCEYRLKSWKGKTQTVWWSRKPVLSLWKQCRLMYKNLEMKIKSQKCNHRFCACISRTFTWISPPKLGCGFTRNVVLLTTEPATPVLYVVKLPVETASVWDLSCKLLHTRECANVLPVYRYDTIDSQKSEDRDITGELP
jgi:hypothetical protein